MSCFDDNQSTQVHRPSQWVEDDTLPTGKYLKERKWVAPFAKANREEDYKIAWAFFEGR